MGGSILSTNDALEAWCDLFAQFDPVALDTEGDSLHCYFEKLCLIQMSVPGHNVLIDPLERLDFTRFNELLARRTIILHGCDYDLRMLRRGIGFVPGPVFDTYLAARLLGLKEVGLAALVKSTFGIDLPKSSQKANWARRPLSPIMIDYAVNDTKYLVDLAEKLGSDLRRLNRWDWFEEAIERAVIAAAEDREKDPERVWMISGSAALKGIGLAILRALWNWRDAEAQQVDRPTFHILRNEELIELAQTAVKGPVRIPDHLSTSRRKRLEETIQAALRLPESDWPQRLRTGRSRTTPEQERRFDQLKLRRDRVAQELQLDPGILAPRQALERVIREPDSAKEVLMRWQRELLLADEAGGADSAAGGSFEADPPTSRR